MLAKETSFSFMSSTISLEVPFFQRGYVWDNANWLELIENLTDDASSHYLGSIVLKSLGSRSGEVPRWSIIDGQQRLTTLSILFKACCDVLIRNVDQNIKKLDEDNDAEQIDEMKRQLRKYEQKQEEILFYTETASSTKLINKITHSHLDAPIYDGIIRNRYARKILENETGINIKDSEKLLQCYKYFLDYLKNNLNDAEKLYNLLLNSNFNILVKIDLDHTENEQAIFDTVNSAGVRLTSADTIKNAIYQKVVEINKDNGISKEEIVKLYKKTWETTFLANEDVLRYWGTQRRIGRLFRDNLEVLLHCVALIKEFYEPDKHTMETLPTLYKRYINDKTATEIDDFINELCEYAVIYKEFFYIPSKTTLFRYDEPIKRLLHILEVCDITTFHAYILKLLKDYDVINNQENLPNGFVDEIKKLETFVLRRVVCGTTTKNFNKVCASLLKGNTNLTQEFNDKEAVISDAVVKSRLQQIYSNKIATLILFWIELYRRNNDNRRNSDNEKELKYSYTLEHVMPQKWETHWSISTCPVMDSSNNSVIADVDEAENARNNAVYELGNMAILNASLNTALKNNTIKIKVEGDGRKKGIAHYAAGIDVCVDVIDVYEKNKLNINPWNEFEIRQRTLKLEKEFLDIWKEF